MLTLAAAPLNTLSMAPLAQQLPSLPNFSGDQSDGDGEGTNDWLERLKLVAGACGWDDQAKLVSVATCFRGSASCFYRCCTPQQRSSYQGIASALQKRFTPANRSKAADSTSGNSCQQRLLMIMPRICASCSPEHIPLFRMEEVQQRPWVSRC